VRWTGGSTPPLRVGPSGEVALPRTIRGRAFRLEVLEADFAPGVPAARRQVRAVGIAEIEGVRGLPAVRIAGRDLATRCGAVRAQVGDTDLALRVAGTSAAFESGRPLRARSCGPDAALSAGRQRLVTRSGPFAIDTLRLSSEAQAPPLGARAGGGRILDPGDAGRGRLDGVQLRVDGPSWLVLGVGYNRGWRAWCGERALGTPEPVDGYANGWRVGSGCHSARFAFAPNRAALAGYVMSLLGCLVCLALVVVDPRRRRVEAVPSLGDLPVGGRAEPWPLGRALAAALAAGAVLAFIFGPIAGAVAVPLIALVLRAGVGSRALSLAAGGLLVLVVPLLYLLHPSDPDRANNVPYPDERIAAHWVVVAALVLLGAALLRTVMLARARGRERLHAPGGPPAHRPRDRVTGRTGGSG
jgi:hypothetical protein